MIFICKKVFYVVNATMKESYYLFFSASRMLRAIYTPITDAIIRPLVQPLLSPRQCKPWIDVLRCSSILILFKRSSRSWVDSIFDAAFIIASLFILGYSKRSETYRSAFSLYTDSKSSEYRILILYSHYFTTNVKRQLNILVHSCCNEVETAMNG